VGYGRAKMLQRLPVEFCAIPFVLAEAVLGVNGIQVFHEVLAAAMLSDCWSPLTSELQGKFTRRPMASVRRASGGTGSLSIARCMASRVAGTMPNLSIS